jgi:hypothetical protein
MSNHHVLRNKQRGLTPLLGEVEKSSHDIPRHHFPRLIKPCDRVYDQRLGVVSLDGMGEGVEQSRQAVAQDAVTGGVHQDDFVLNGFVVRAHRLCPSPQPSRHEGRRAFNGDEQNGVTKTGLLDGELLHHQTFASVGDARDVDDSVRRETAQRLFDGLTVTDFRHKNRSSNPSTPDGMPNKRGARFPTSRSNSTLSATTFVSSRSSTSAGETPVPSDASVASAAKTSSSSFGLMGRRGMQFTSRLASPQGEGNLKPLIFLRP